MDKKIFTKIEQRTVQGRVVDLVRDAIISGVLAPGERLTESVIADQMAVSRAPLREALRQLEQEGLVVRLPNHGCFVTDFSEHDVIEIFSLRAALECMSIRWAVTNLSADDFATLRAGVEECRQAIKANDPDRLTHLDMQFHQYICSRACHGRLLRAWLSNNAQARMLLNSRFRLLSDYTPDQVLTDHSDMIAALERGDADAAIALTEEISARVAHDCMQLLRSKRPLAA